MDSPAARSLVVAAAVHAAAIAAVLLVGSRLAPLSTAEAPAELVEIELGAIEPASDVEPRDTEPEPIAPTPAPTHEVATAKTTTPRHVPAPAAAKVAPAPQLSAGAIAHAAPSAAPTETPAPRGDARTATGWMPRAVDLDALGLGKRNVFVNAVPAPAGPAEAPPNPARNVQRALRDALREHDRGLGLGADGPVIAVAEDVARRSHAAVNSRAVFVVTADATGMVTSVYLANVSEDAMGWGHVATTLLGALRTRKLRVAPGANGVSVTLEVTSRVQLPSGSDPETEVSIAGIPVKRARGGRPALRVDMLPILSIMGDPSDIGAQPVRIVHARTLGQTDL